MYVITDSCSPLNPLISLFPSSLLMFLSFIHCLSFFFLISLFPLSFFFSSFPHWLCFFFSQTLTLTFVSLPYVFQFLLPPFLSLILLSLSALLIIFPLTSLLFTTPSTLFHPLPTQRPPFFLPHVRILVSPFFCLRAFSYFFLSSLFFFALSSSSSAENELRQRGQQGRPGDEGEEELGELEDELWGLRALQKQELNKVRGSVELLLLLFLWAEPLTCPAPSLLPKIQSNLGKIILKEELEKSAAPLRRKTRSLPDRSQQAGRPLCCPLVVCSLYNNTMMDKESPLEVTLFTRCGKLLY